MNAVRYVDISTDLLHDIEEQDAARRLERDSIEVRAIAGMLRKDGWSDQMIKERFGYIPTPIPPRVRPNARNTEYKAEAKFRR